MEKTENNIVFDTLEEDSQNILSEEDLIKDLEEFHNKFAKDMIEKRERLRKEVFIYGIPKRTIRNRFVWLSL